MRDQGLEEMTAADAIKDSAFRINRSVVLSAFLKLAGVLASAAFVYIAATGNAWLKTQIADQVAPLSAQITELSQQIKPIQETLAKSAEKDRADDILANESRQRLALIEQNMARGRADRDRQLAEILDAIKEVRGTQLETAAKIGALQGALNSKSR